MLFSAKIKDQNNARRQQNTHRFNGLGTRLNFAVDLRVYESLI